MPLPANVNRVVVRGRWFAERTGGGSGLPIAFSPVPTAGTSPPNVTDLAAFSWIKTQAATVTPDPVTAYYAVALTSNNDPDLTAFAGWRVTPQGETPFTIDVPYDSPTVTVDADMHAAIPELAVGEQVQAIWLTEAAQTGVTPPTPVTAFYTAEQTRSVVASGIQAHNADTGAHPDIRALAGSGGGGGASQLTVTRTAAVALSGHRAVTPGASGLVYASNATLAHLAAPLWLTAAAASSGASVAAVTAGPVVEPSWAWTPGPVYLGTNGQLTQTAPAAPGALFCAQIGYAVSATELHVDRTPSIRLS